MYASRINSINGMQSGYLFWYSRTRYLVDQRAKTGILLWRSTHYSKRPNGILAVIYIMHLHQRERMFKAVITQMITKRAFRLIIMWHYHACYYKVCVG